MNSDLAQELLNELGSSLENLEAQQAALLNFLKDKGTVTDEKFAPYLTQAGNASSVRWRAARVRLARLISAEQQKEDQTAEKEQQQAGTAKAPPQNLQKEANSKTDQSSAEATAQHQAAVANAPSESPGVQSAPKKSSEQDEREASKDKNTSPEHEKDAA